MVVEAGFRELEGVTVISDRALEGSVRLQAGQPVLLVDDAIILGTTLVDLYDVVAGMVGGSASVEVLVAWVDEDRRNADFLQHLGLPLRGVGAPLARPQKVLEAGAEDIARALYQAGRPYFTDFPLVEEIEVDREIWERLKGTSRWMAADVSPPAEFAGAHRQAITFVPRAEVERTIRARGVAEAMGVLEGLKVRTYATVDGPGTVALRIVPIGLPGAMTKAHLVRTLAAVQARLALVGDEEPGPLPHGWRDWRPAAQHRLLQMYLSTCLLAEFWKDLNAAGDRRALHAGMLDDTHISCYFGPVDSAIVRTSFDDALVAYEEAGGDEPVAATVPLSPRSGLAGKRQVRQSATRVRHTSAEFLEAAEHLGSLVRSGPPSVPAPGEVAKVDRFWVHRILSIFGDVDTHLERPQEEELRKLSYAEYKQRRDEQSSRAEGADERIVKLGIAMVELADLVGLAGSRDDDDEGCWSRALLSLAIDVGNDMGVVVPSTVAARGKRGPVFRQYRSGEMAFAVNVPHEQLARVEHDEVERCMDRFTLMTVADAAANEAEDVQVFTRMFQKDVREITRRSRGDETILQEWVGEVIDVDAEGFVVSASSLFDDGVMADERLTWDSIAGIEPDAVHKGAVLEWSVVEPGAQPERYVVRRMFTPTSN